MCQQATDLPQKKNLTELLRWACTPGTTAAVALLALVVATGEAKAQTFNSESDGSDGELRLLRPIPDPNPQQEIIIDFDPDAFDPPLDTNHDKIYHFTTITIAANVRVRLTAAHLSGAIVWLAAGDVQIDGIVDLNGQDGQSSDLFVNNASRLPALPGAGGFAGGIAGTADSAPQWEMGRGEGSLTRWEAVGQAYLRRGEDGIGNCAGAGGSARWLNLRERLSGSSRRRIRRWRGGGSGPSPGGDGGAGGGAILIASSSSITVNGVVRSEGGNGGNGALAGGGGGSGGSVRLAAPNIAGTGTIVAVGGTGGTGTSQCCINCGGVNPRGNVFYGGAGSAGRIRLESFQQDFPVSNSNPTAILDPL